MTEIDADVIVAGAGPTGLMLAGELRLRGVSVTVIERLDEPMKQSRALGFSARTIEEFGQRGLLPRFDELQTIPVGHFGGLTIDYRVLEGGSYGARGKPQSLTEAILAQWAAELGARLYRGQEVTGLSPDAEGVSVTVQTPGGVRRMRASYVVGCDGGRSTVRKLAGIGFPGTEAAIEMWLADVAGCELRPRFSGERVPGGMVMVLPMGPGVNRVVVYERDAAPRHGIGAPAFTEVADAWERLTGEDIHDAAPLWVSWFTDSSRQASEYRHGRVFVAGDAAHVHLPIGGQGMSAGIQDAVNLGWKLAASLQGWGGDQLLDSYGEERRSVFASTARDFIEKAIQRDKEFLQGYDPDIDKDAFEREWTARQSGARSEVDSFAPNYQGSSVVWGPPGSSCSAVGSHQFAARAGHHLTPLQLACGQNVYEQLGEGFCLIELAPSDGIAQSFAAAAKTLNIPLKIISDTSQQGGAFYQAGLVLVRPDQFVAWTSNEAVVDATAILRRAAGLGP
jgi:2-polyprenyl-6-methoxyphenol hydroxylase-like FAD-dependent oxidoreductase